MFVRYEQALPDGPANNVLLEGNKHLWETLQLVRHFQNFSGDRNATIHVLVGVALHLMTFRIVFQYRTRNVYKT